MDRFEGNLLAAFEAADGRNDEAVMRDAAEGGWWVYDGQVSGYLNQRKKKKGGE